MEARAQGTGGETTLRHGGSGVPGDYKPKIRLPPGIGCINRKMYFSIFCNACYSYLSPAAMPHAPIQGRMHQTVAWWHQIRLFVLSFVSTQSYVFFGPVDSYSNFINSFLRFLMRCSQGQSTIQTNIEQHCKRNIFQILRERCVLQLWCLAAPLDPALPFHIAVPPARILGISEASRHQKGSKAGDRPNAVTPSCRRMLADL